MKQFFLSTGLLAILLPGALRADDRKLTIIVAAGKQDRIQAPVTVPLTLSKDLARSGTVTVTLADGKSVSGQLTTPGLLTEPSKDNSGGLRCDLHFVLPALKAGQTQTLTAILNPSTASSGFSWHDTPGEFSELRLQDRPVLRYMYKALDDSSKENREQTFKVYHHLFDPSGSRIITKGPGGLYTHHRGLFYGFNKVIYGDGRKADIWHCTGDTHQSHEKVLSAEAGPVLGRHRLEIAWHGVGKEVFAREEREMTVYNVPGGRLVEFASRLRGVLNPVKLDGDPQHAGFHFRADNEVSAKTSKQTYYLRPDGQGKPGETRNWPAQKQHVNLPWDAMSFVLGEQRYTVAYLDKPTNPKEARFSERDYGRFGSYFEYEVTAEKPLVVNYRVWLQEGEMSGGGVAALGENFVSPVEVTVK